MRKILVFLLAIAITGIISGAGACPEVVGPSEIEIKPVVPAKKTAITRPFFRLDKAEIGIEKMVEVTAYSSESGDLTFSETEPEWGTVAVDPEFIPLGSIVMFPDVFPGFKFVAVDTGTKVNGWKVDLWLPDNGFTKYFGVQKMRAVIQKPPV